MNTEFNSELAESNKILKLFRNLQNRDTDTVVESVIKGESFAKESLKNDEVCFYRIKQLSFDEDYPHREAFENVLLSLDNQAFNFAYILTGTKEGIELCIGVVKNKNENKPILGKMLSAVNYGEIIANVFEGNFGGSELEKLKAQEFEELIRANGQKYKNAGVILGIPSVSEEASNKEYDFQGMDRLINSMLGLEWRLAIVCEPISKREILEIREAVYELYNWLSIYSKKTLQYSENDSQTVSYGITSSASKGSNTGYNKSDATSKGKQSGTQSSSTQHQEGYSEGKSENTSTGKNSGWNKNHGYSSAVTIEMANKHAEELMRYINESLLERLKVGFSKGMFQTSVYYMAKEPTHANRLKGGIIALFQGSKATYSPLHAKRIDLGKENNFELLCTYQNQYIREPESEEDVLRLLGIPFYEAGVGLNTYLTAKEVSILAGLPQKEVPGLALKESVAFGLNEKGTWRKEDGIKLGQMIQKGRRLKELPFILAPDSIAKHIFVAGVTGSGKTTTCHRLLLEANMPFLVIEPAKTEYRSLLVSSEYENNKVVVFTLGNERIAPFRINPFELVEGEVVSAHIDMVKATFTSAFPMEASMPQILEEAIYRCYEKKGWDVNQNTCCYCPKRYPILSDLLEEFDVIVKEKNFGTQLQADYIGSLKSRLSNLTVGSKGSMLNCEYSVNFEELIHRNVVLEMEEMKSSEDKALLMGFILSRLSAVIKAEHRKNPRFRHVTLIEEAHRLLSKVEFGDSGSKKAAIETFTDLLAEVRKYGEGLIIVDQIPNKLAPEVLKNTNTKIIHKILARDDKEAVGDTMRMDERQKEYLSALEVGEAIIFSENTNKPIHVCIEKAGNTEEQQLEDEVVRECFQERKKEGKKLFGLSYGLEGELGALEKLLDEVVKGFFRLKPEQKKCDLLKDAIEKTEKNLLAKGERVTKEELWKKLLERRDAISGKAAASQMEQEKRISLLTKFFSEDFYKKDFSEKEIQDQKIYLYL